MSHVSRETAATTSRQTPIPASSVSVRRQSLKYIKHVYRPFPAAII